MTERKLANVASSLSLTAADAICTEALAFGREHELLPLTVVVIDSGGHIVCLKREDGCGTVRVGIALAKASAVVGMGVSSRLLGARLRERVAFQNAIAAASDGRFAAVPGGVAILDEDGDIVGAVGISGDASDRDEAAAIHGIHQAGLASDPPEAAPNWKEAGL
ncbi:MAG: heme-binding protein [Alphaproteobacteria bacterium]